MQDTHRARMAVLPLQKESQKLKAQLAELNMATTERGEQIPEHLGCYVCLRRMSTWKCSCCE